MESILAFGIEHWGAIALLLAIATILTMLAPRFLPAAARARAAAGISANWLFLPPVIMLLVFMGADLKNWGADRMGGAVYTFLFVEVVLGATIIYRHRQWPWSAAALFAIAMAWSLAMITIVGLSQIPFY